MGLLETMKQVVQATNDAGMPTAFLFGSVTKTSPLTIRVDNRFDISGDAIVVMKGFQAGFYPTHYHTGVKGMLVFLCAYLANVAFSLWYNIKIRKEDFDREKLIASGLKILVFVVGLTLLCTAMAQAQIEANKRFRKKSYDRIEITVPKGDREKIVQAASAAGMSVNAFIKEALVEYIARTTKQ